MVQRYVVSPGSTTLGGGGGALRHSTSAQTATATSTVAPAPSIIRSVSARHPEAALDFAIAHWDKLSKMLEASSGLRFVPGLTGNSTNLKTIDKLNAFAAARVPENARQDYVLAIARIRYSAKVRAMRLPEVDRWLAAQAR